MVVSIIRPLWPEHVAELENELQANCRLTFATAKPFIQPARQHHMNTRITDDMGDKNNTDNSSLRDVSSSYMAANLVDKQHSHSMYPTSDSRASTDTCIPNNNCHHHHSFFVQRPRERIQNL